MPYAGGRLIVAKATATRHAPKYFVQSQDYTVDARNFVFRDTNPASLANPSSGNVGFPLNDLGTLAIVTNMDVSAVLEGQFEESPDGTTYTVIPSAAAGFRLQPLCSCAIHIHSRMPFVRLRQIPTVWVLARLMLVWADVRQRTYQAATARY